MSWIDRKKMENPYYMQAGADLWGGQMSHATKKKNYVKVQVKVLHCSQQEEIVSYNKPHSPVISFKFHAMDGH